jgi:hypothetical protein
MELIGSLNQYLTQLPICLLLVAVAVALDMLAVAVLVDF